LAIDPTKLINLGTDPNDSTGDPIRVGGIKLNNIITEIYAAITPAGANVGIGTTTPGVILDVVSPNAAGQIRARYGTSADGLVINQTSSGGPVNINQKANADMILSANNTQMVWVKKEGKVGIGTSSPSSTLQVHASANSTFRLTDGSSGSTDTDGLVFSKYNGFADVWLFESEELRFGTNNTEKMRVGANGNVGIGNNASTNKLSVGGDVWLSGNSIVGKNVNYSGNLTSNAVSYIYSYAGGSLGQYRSGLYLDGTNQEVILYTSNIERIHINSTGDFEMGSQANVVNNLRTLDVTNKDPSSGAGAAVRLVSTDAAGTGDTVSADLIKYKTGEFTVYNREVNATAGFTSFVFNPAGVKNEVLRITANNRIIVNGAIVASAGVGTAGQVLTSNGTSNVYWSTPVVFTVNVDAQYTWTNNHTFTNSISFSNTITVTGNSTFTGNSKFSNSVLIIGNTTFSNTINLAASGIKFSDSTTQTTAAVSYTLPTASDSVLGGVKVGSGLTITSGVLSSTAGGFGNMQVFTSSGTFTVPAGVTKVKVHVTGGGGGATMEPGTAGGGGGTAIKIISGLTPGASITVTVGGGGGPASSYNGSGTGGTGGTSSFGGYCSATGGAGGVSVSQKGGAGGIGSNGDLNLAGDPGFGGDADSGPNPNGGSSFWGGGALGWDGSSTGNGRNYGGGGGATNLGAGTGGAGSGGVVVVEY
jgi:hypothetical protein